MKASKKGTLTRIVVAACVILLALAATLVPRWVSYANELPLIDEIVKMLQHETRHESIEFEAPISDLNKLHPYKRENSDYYRKVIELGRESFHLDGNKGVLTLVGVFEVKNGDFFKRSKFTWVIELEKIDGEWTMVDVDIDT